MLGGRTASLVGAELPVPLPDGGETAEIDLTTISGTPMVVEVRTSHIDWAQQESTLVILHDITMRKQAEIQLRDSFVTLADTLSRAMASRDPYTTDHQQRVAALVVLVGSRMGLGEERLWALRLGGLLHDIGKVSVPESLLTKPGKLTSEEFALAQTHAQEGFAILKDTGLPPAVALMALHHHEFLNGTGYPEGLTGESLSLEDRILVACNLVESLTSFRPYRRAFKLDAAVARLVDGSGTNYDPSVVSCVTELISRGEFLPDRL
jgi:putative nucleotidyltransferase with HDIG domain